MQMTLRKCLAMVLSAVMVAALPLMATAENRADQPQRLVMQASTGDPVAQNTLLDTAVKLLGSTPADANDIEIVAYGPGLSLVLLRSETSGRVADLASRGIQVSACGTSIEEITSKTGQQPQLAQGVERVVDGQSRILQLQQQGYAYLRP
jgi:intracellular sulfur oxidation DsrE/DsrF family protein